MLPSPLRRRSPCHGLGWVAVAAMACVHPADGATWRIGDQDQPWRLYPVSFLFNAGEVFLPDFQWGGANSMEVVVDDDGDGVVDEDPVDLVDDDRDGRFNEDIGAVDLDKDGNLDDQVDLQIDNDGDGLLNEDGLRSGGMFRDRDLAAKYRSSPFWRRATPDEATGDTTQALGYGWGDDDRDSRFNEDPQDGIDNDGDGLVDEDDAGPPDAGVPQEWTKQVFAYPVEGITVEQRQALRFAWDAGRKAFTASGPDGQEVVARVTRRSFRPKDWIRPLRADSTRNLVALVEDRYLSGIFGTWEPITSQWWADMANGLGAVHEGESGNGQMVDGSVFTARVVSINSVTAGFRADLEGLFALDLLRFRPRPDFPDRTPTSYAITFIGDRPDHFRRSYSLGEIVTQLAWSDPLVPQQMDQLRPAVKEYRFDKDGAFGPSVRVRMFDMRSRMPGGQIWELAEFEAYGHGYSMDASYMSEVIDVGPARPRYRRYFDAAEPTRPVPFESVQTADDSRNGKIEPAETAAAKLNAQFDTAAVGQPVTWGRMRWKGTLEGKGGDVLVRVRAGTSLDPTVYVRKVGGGLVSPYVSAPLVADWPAPGTRIDAYSYAMMSLVDRPGYRALPYNTMSDRDGIRGGWTPWSAPYGFRDGLVEVSGQGGILLSLPPLTRYIQFRFDFVSTEDSGVSLDWLEVDFSPPVVSRGVLAEIYPDRAERLGQTEAFQYILRPNLATTDLGFNRIEVALPSPQADIDSLLVDDLAWQRMVPAAGAGGKAWMDTVKVGQRQFAAAVYVDTATQATRLGIKTRLLTSQDFPRGQDKDIRLDFHTPVYKLMTQFDSWIWNDAATAVLPQPTTPGNAADRLPADQVVVTVQEAGRSLELRQVSPNPFSPNGDGINDAARFGFDLFLLTRQAQVEVDIYDLSGRMLRRLGPVGAGAGQQQLTWDGRDDAGACVAPGVYVYRLTVDSDTEGSKTVNGTVSVAY